MAPIKQLIGTNAAKHQFGISLLYFESLNSLKNLSFSLLSIIRKNDTYHKKGIAKYPLQNLIICYCIKNRKPNWCRKKYWYKCCEEGTTEESRITSCFLKQIRAIEIII